METVRAFMRRIIHILLLGRPKNGSVKPLEKAGLGVELKDEFLQRSDLSYRVSESEALNREEKVYTTSAIGDPWKT